MNLVIYILFFFIFVVYITFVSELVIGAVSGMCAFCETARSIIRAVNGRQLSVYFQESFYLHEFSGNIFMLIWLIRVARIFEQHSEPMYQAV